MQKSPPVPHSWTIESWPADIFPRTASRARYVLRAHRDELTAAGALARVGRELVVIGARYAKWIELHTADVSGFEIAPNRDRSKVVA